MKQEKLLLSVIGIAMLLSFVTTMTASAYVTPQGGSLTVDMANGSLKDQINPADYQSITSLKVTGEIGGYDMNVFADLSNLITLDLSEASTSLIRCCSDLKYLEVVKLPSTVKEVEKEAFQGCESLKSINLSNVLNIGENSFQNCSSLSNIDLSNVLNIERMAFESCYALNEANLSSVKTIEGYAFSGCESLSSVILNPEIERFYGQDVFSGCPIEELSIYDKVEMSWGVLQGAKLKKLHVHSNQNYNGDVWAYNGMSELTDVYIYDPIPGNIDISRMKNTTLHVPGFNISAYTSDKNNPSYWNFGEIIPLGENLKTLKVYSDLDISSNEDLEDKFDLTLTRYAESLENNAPNPLILGDFVQYYRLDSYSDGYNYTYRPSSTFINNGTVTADNVSVVMNLRNSKDLWGESGWSFISFPFDVNIQNIITPSEALWVIREYDGDIRAKRTETGDNSQTESAWVNVTTPTLKARKGYILHFSSNNGSEFTFPSIDNKNKNNIFSNGDVTIPLNYYSSKYPHNASWNLIGNPFDACFDTHQISDGKSPSQVITVWRSRDTTYDGEGNQRYGTYESFSLVDDNYVLTPFEAFFIQATGENTKLTFHKEGRQHGIYEKQNQHHAPKRMVASNEDRSIFNLHIDGNGCSDRTRLVINEDASTNYEIGCDASKFLSHDESVPQIFMVQDGQNLAINERPMGTGIFRVGTVFGIDGDYTITSDTRNANCSVILCDAETGIETDITESGYTFNAKKGTDNNRFSIRLKAGESGISDVKADNFNVTLHAGNLSVTADGEINIFTIDGKLVASGAKNLETSVSKGIYVVKAAGKTKKVTY